MDGKRRSSGILKVQAPQSPSRENLLASNLGHVIASDTTDEDVKKRRVSFAPALEDVKEFVKENSYSHSKSSNEADSGSLLSFGESGITSEKVDAQAFLQRIGGVGDGDIPLDKTKYFDNSMDLTGANFIMNASVPPVSPKTDMELTGALVNQEENLSAMDLTKPIQHLKPATVELDRSSHGLTKFLETCGLDVGTPPKFMQETSMKLSSGLNPELIRAPLKSTGTVPLDKTKYFSNIGDNSMELTGVNPMLQSNNLSTSRMDLSRALADHSASAERKDVSSMDFTKPVQQFTTEEFEVKDTSMGLKNALQPSGNKSLTHPDRMSFTQTVPLGPVTVELDKSSHSLRSYLETSGLASGNQDRSMCIQEASMELTNVLIPETTGAVKKGLVRTPLKPVTVQLDKSSNSMRSYLDSSGLELAPPIKFDGPKTSDVMRDYLSKVGDPAAFGNQGRSQGLKEVSMEFTGVLEPEPSRGAEKSFGPVTTELDKSSNGMRSYLESSGLELALPNEQVGPKTSDAMRDYLTRVDPALGKQEKSGSLKALSVFGNQGLKEASMEPETSRSADELASVSRKSRRLTIDDIFGKKETTKRLSEMMSFTNVVGAQVEPSSPPEAAALEFSGYRANASNDTGELFGQAKQIATMIGKEEDQSTSTNDLVGSSSSGFNLSAVQDINLNSLDEDGLLGATAPKKLKFDHDVVNDATFEIKRGALGSTPASSVSEHNTMDSSPEVPVLPSRPNVSTRVQNESTLQPSTPADPLTADSFFDLVRPVFKSKPRRSIIIPSFGQARGAPQDGTVFENTVNGIVRTVCEKLNDKVEEAAEAARENIDVVREEWNQNPPDLATQWLGLNPQEKAAFEQNWLQIKGSFDIKAKIELKKYKIEAYKKAIGMIRSEQTAMRATVNNFNKMRLSFANSREVLTSQLGELQQASDSKDRLDRIRNNTSLLATHFQKQQARLEDEARRETEKQRILDDLRGRSCPFQFEVVATDDGGFKFDFHFECRSWKTPAKFLVFVTVDKALNVQIQGKIKPQYKFALYACKLFASDLRKYAAEMCQGSVVQLMDYIMTRALICEKLMTELCICFFKFHPKFEFREIGGKSFVSATRLIQLSTFLVEGVFLIGTSYPQQMMHHFKVIVGDGGDTVNKLKDIVRRIIDTDNYLSDVLSALEQFEKSCV